MENELYDYSPIVDRPVVSWPDGKRVAFYLGLNIEHFRVNLAGSRDYSTMARVASDPEPITKGWRDYGTRVGIWRMIDLLDECGVTATAITNSEVVDFHPQIIDAGLERDWAWVAHGRTNSVLHGGFETPGAEAGELDAILETFAARGIHPRGWMGPGLSETFETNRLLRERGFDYNLDWIADDRPFPMREPGMWSVPYSLEVNDAYLYSQQSTLPREYPGLVLGHLDVLLAEGGGVFALPVHPHRVGAPSRFGAFAQVVRAIAAHPDVWVTTSDAIASHYQHAAAGLPAATTTA